MAERELKIVIGAKDSYSAELNRFALKLGAISGMVTAGMTKAFDLLGAAVRGSVSFMNEAVAAAEEQENAEKKLFTALGHTSYALLAQAEALQKVTAFGDEQIIGVQASIAAFIRDENQIKKATKATLDFAAAKGMDLATAGDLVAKSLGAEADALKRHGVAVEGAAGSTERLESLVKNISALYGGQAAAAAQTYAGAMTQTKNAFGEVIEEIGNLIVRNGFVVNALHLLRNKFFELADIIKNNRQYLMELVKGGLLTLVEGLYYAIETMRFFHNGWLGIKLAVQSVEFAVVTVVEKTIEALRFVLLPIDLMYQGLMKLGLVTFNPFDEALRVVGQFKAAVVETGAATLDEMEKVNAGYTAAGNAVKGFGEELKKMSVTQAEVAGGNPRPELTHEHTKAWEAVEKKILDTEQAIAKLSNSREREITLQAQELVNMGATSDQLERYVKLLLSEDEVKKEQAAQKAREGLVNIGKGPGVQYGGPALPEFVGEQEAMQKRQEQLADFHANKINMMIAAGATELEITAAMNQAQLEHDQQTQQMRLSAAAGTAGTMANILQNLYTATGSKNKELFAIMKAFAIGEAIINTYQGATKALSTVPYPFNFVAAASVVAAGMAQVAKINSTQPGSATGTISAGGTATAPYQGGSPSAYPVPSRMESAAPTQNVTLIVNSLDPSTINWDRLMADNIRPALEKLSGDGNVPLNIRVASA